MTAYRENATAAMYYAGRYATPGKMKILMGILIAMIQTAGTASYVRVLS